MKIGIIGNGFVGKATRQLECPAIELYVYDIRPELCIPQGLTLSQMSECELIFICVPTPMEASGKCHLGIVESVVRSLEPYVDPSKNFLVIRSTVPIGTSDRLGCSFMPEFLTEKNYVQDFITCANWVFGVAEGANGPSFQEAITRMIRSAKAAGRIEHDVIHFRTNREAEMIKYVRNCFLATKVSFCNEMEEFCSLKGIEYENVRSFAMLDSRIGESHSRVPGHDGKRGFGGTCFPKDTSSLLYQMDEVRMTSYVINSIVERNLHVDRKEKDWAEDKGRAVI
jgi:UDPglucose 6-dehydrogenase